MAVHQAVKLVLKTTGAINSPNTSHLQGTSHLACWNGVTSKEEARAFACDFTKV